MRKMENVEEYIDFIWGQLNELAFEHITYSEYDQMTDWLDEIRKGVKGFELAEQEYIAKIKKLELEIDNLQDEIGDLLEYF